MDFLKAVNKNDDDFKEKKLTEVQIVQDEKEDFYIENVKDTHIINMIDELRELCWDFIDHSEMFSTFEQKTNFVLDILEHFERNAKVEYVEDYDESSDEDD
tara:strand:- start:1976 stop:2278 length:303 start_codon:yes stop_codon:yes gene_type:complete